jgi:hypothetical protein
VTTITPSIAASTSTVLIGLTVLMLSALPVRLRRHRRPGRDRRPTRALGLRSERGEGVISVAIAVLIMAVLGALLFTAFKSTTDDMGTRTDEVVKKIK